MTDVRCEPTETRVHVDGTQTSVQIDLTVNIEPDLG